MYLTRREYETFRRGQSAGLIPQDCPVPANEKEADNLIIHIGLMFSRTVGCRTKAGRLFFVTVAAFSEEYLPELIRKLPELHPEVFAVTQLQREEYFSSLDALAYYFALGPGAMNEKDIAARLAAYNQNLAINEIRKGFELNFEPETVSGLATTEQRIALSERIAQHALPPITRRTWENLTEREAASILAQQHPANKIPTAVQTTIQHYDRLTLEEKVMFRELTTKNRRKTHD